jgi:hypothetical protein
VIKLKSIILEIVKEEIKYFSDKDIFNFKKLDDNLRNFIENFFKLYNDVYSDDYYENQNVILNLKYNNPQSVFIGSYNNRLEIYSTGKNINVRIKNKDYSIKNVSDLLKIVEKHLLNFVNSNR